MRYLAARHVSRRAFTLVELLVVIAIIGTLVGLLLPAVQAARESARRSTCMNNTKQIALAVQSYESAARQYPPGNSTELIMNAEYGGKDYRTWAIFLLPYLESAPLYADVMRTMPSVNGATTWQWQVGLAYNSPMAVFCCPSDPNANKVELIAKDSRGFYSNYRGVAGSTTFNPRGKIEGGNAGTYAEPAANASTDGGTRLNGIFFARSKVRPKDVTDGTSKTLVVAEGVNVPYTTAGYWFDTRGSLWMMAYLGSALVSTQNTPNTTVGDRLRYCAPHPRAPCAGLAGGTPGTSANAGPADNMVSYARSYHQGVYAGLADGAVVFYSESVDAAVWTALGTRAGGEAIASQE
jgi:prepilin-type N-terminal cleavage/methylation domain-containing protein